MANRAVDSRSEQEIPSSVAQDQLETAMAQRLDAASGVPAGPDSAPGASGRDGVLGAAGAVLALAAAIAVAAAGRRRRRRRGAEAEVRRRMVEEARARESAVARPRSRGEPRMIELPPHVVATLERLAHERAERTAEAERAEDAEDDGVRGGFEAWIS